VPWHGDESRGIRTSESGDRRASVALLNKTSNWCVLPPETYPAAGHLISGGKRWPAALQIRERPRNRAIPGPPLFRGFETIKVKACSPRFKPSKKSFVGAHHTRLGFRQAEAELSCEPPFRGSNIRRIRSRQLELNNVEAPTWPAQSLDRAVSVR